MDQSKPWYQSKGTWGAIISILAMGALLLNMPISVADQTELINDGVAVGGVVASIVALYGRLVARHKLTLTNTNKGN